MDTLIDKLACLLLLLAVYRVVKNSKTKTETKVTPVEAVKEVVTKEEESDEKKYLEQIYEDVDVGNYHVILTGIKGEKMAVYINKDFLSGPN